MPRGPYCGGRGMLLGDRQDCSILRYAALQAVCYHYIGYSDKTVQNGLPWLCWWL